MRNEMTIKPNHTLYRLYRLYRLGGVVFCFICHIVYFVMFDGLTQQNPVTFLWYESIYVGLDVG